jgi:Amt family ammonium transporter
MDSEANLKLLLVVLVKVMPAKQQELRQSLNGILPTLASLMCQEYQFNNELNTIASELTERYEELNLIYETDDQVSQYSQGKESLQRLVKNCAEYLNVSIATLILPDKNITIFHNNDHSLVSFLNRVISQLETFIFPRLQATKESLVINDASDFAESGLDYLIYKFVVCPVFQGDGSVSGILVILKDINQEDFTNSDRNLMDVMSRKASKIIQANYDALTGLTKRAGFEFELNECLVTAQKMNLSHCVLFLDIDRIHIINDVASHQAGDELIKKIAKLILTHLRDTDIVARLGGDEFGIIIMDCPREQGVRISEKLRRRISALHFMWDDNQYEVSASIGLVMITANIQAIENVLASAEIATNAVKEQGGNRVLVYEQGDADLDRRKKEMFMFNDIRDALRTDRFELYCQPIESLAQESSLPHAEVLIRLLDKDSKPVSPGMFLPAAERYHLMPSIDSWVINKTLSLLSRYWQELGGLWSINLSGQSLGEQGFLDFVVDQLRRASIPAQHVCFEITETAAIENIDQANHFILSLKKLGCYFSLDDFGSGLSSFAYLKKLKVDYLKIDGAFVKGIIDDPVSEAIVSSINHIGHKMGLQTIAEFVESDDIKKYLYSLGIDHGQGYFIGKPRPLEGYLYELSAIRQRLARSG